MFLSGGGDRGDRGVREFREFRESRHTDHTTTTKTKPYTIRHRVMVADYWSVATSPLTGGGLGVGNTMLGLRSFPLPSGTR